jgi:hypothetical protein
MAESQAKSAIDVTQVAGRRELHFSSLGEILAEAERLVQHGARVRPLGNLTLGQALKHLALTMHASLDGFGFSVPPEVLERGRAYKDYVLTSGMRAGTKLPPEGEARFIPACCTPEAGLAELNAAAARLQAGTPQPLHPYLGELSPQEWISLQCRHAELHLGFMAVEA